jgi:Flp pilus assembly protein TadD
MTLVAFCYSPADMLSNPRRRDKGDRKICGEMLMLLFWPEAFRPVKPFPNALLISIALALCGILTPAIAQENLGPEIETKIASAIQDLKAGNLDSAENAFSALIHQRVKHPLIYHNLGVIAVLRGNHAEAVTQFHRALVLQPDNGSTRLLLGSSLLELRKNAEAVRELKRAATLLPDEPQVHLELGTAYEALGNWIAAVQEFQKLVKLAPQEPEFSYDLGNAWTKLSDWSFREIIKLDPHSPRVQMGLGLELAAQGRHDEALAAYRQAVRSDPAIPEVHLAMALTYLEMRKFEEAASEVAQELELVPESKAAAEVKAKIQAARAASSP